jgi:SAM-dependent methyltransferase
MALGASDLLFDTVLFLSRRQRALLRAQANPKSPFFLHNFALEGNIETIKTLKPDFDNALELFSGNGEFVSAMADENLLGAGGKIKSISLYEPAFAQFSGVKCINEIDDLPLEEDKYDLIIANSCLNWVNDLPGFLARIKRALKKDGLFIASFLGGRTLNELRQSLLEVEAQETGGASMRVSPMIDLENAAVLLRRAGFVSPVSSSEVLRARYDNVFALFRDLKAMGENAAFANRNAAALNRQLIAKIATNYQDKNVDNDGRVGATFEIITVSAWN